MANKTRVTVGKLPVASKRECESFGNTFRSWLSTSPSSPLYFSTFGHRLQLFLAASTITIILWIHTSCLLNYSPDVAVYSANTVFWRETRAYTMVMVISYPKAIVLLLHLLGKDRSAVLE